MAGVVAGLSTTEYLFHDYEPHIFRRIRELSGVKNSEYVRALQSVREARGVVAGAGLCLVWCVDDIALPMSPTVGPAADKERKVQQRRLQRCVPVLFQRQPIHRQDHGKGDATAE